MDEYYGYVNTNSQPIWHACTFEIIFNGISWLIYGNAIEYGGIIIFTTLDGSKCFNTGKNIWK